MQGFSGVGLGLIASFGLAATAHAAPLSDAELRGIIAAQQSQIEALQARLAALEAARSPAVSAQALPLPAAAPAQVDPRIVETKADTTTETASTGPVREFSAQPTSVTGLNFRVKGRFMYDTAYVENPGNSIPTKDLGFYSGIRRFRIGVVGGLNGGFGYSGEIDFADREVGYGDVVLTWKQKKPNPGDGHLEMALGNFEPLDGFEQISSSRHSAFLERAQFNDAFLNVRRLGAAASWVDPGHSIRASAGLFGQTISKERGTDGWGASARVIYTPKIGATQLHFGLNFQHRQLQSNILANNFRVRPFIRATDTRFVATGELAVHDENVLGGEFVAIRGPAYLAAEAQTLLVHTIRPGEVLTGGDQSLGRRTNGDARFFGWHVQAGYWLTGESQGYANGLWDRTLVRNPVDKGGPGAISINARYDHIDLTDRVGRGDTAADLIDGGHQTGYLASIIWQPIDYVRFTLQYTHGVVRGGPFQPIVNPSLTDNVFHFNAGGVRGAFDF